MKLRYPKLGLSEVRRWKPVMKSLGVSEVARSKRGFLTALERARGVYSVMGRNPRNNRPWQDERNAFVARHLTQIRSEPLFETRPDGSVCPTRRHLALVAWDYSPAPSKLKKLNPKKCR